MIHFVGTHHIGVVYKKNSYVKMLEPGSHFIMPGYMVHIHSRIVPLEAGAYLDIFLKDEKLKALLHVVEVSDNEIVLLLENGNFKRVLTPGRYTFWKGFIQYEFRHIDLSKIEVDASLDKTLLMKPEVASYLRLYAVNVYEKGLLYIDNKFEKILEPGNYIFWKNATVISVISADTRQLQLEVSGQEILTKDKAVIRINFMCQYHITDIVKALINVKEYEKQLYIILQLAVREYIGNFTIDELLEKKEEIGTYISEKVKDSCESIGVAINYCGIKDVILPGEVKDILNQVLIAEKKAQANMIMRREETASTRSLLNTAKLMEENELLFRLKELEYIERISDKVSSISLSGGNQIIEQLRDMFVRKDTKE